ncbi:MAG TPA: nuclear transport factor 2 family protein [Gammaproteobacteria bacterium]|nr:nuclear transport factor 2 family protein [Gammaproteobacteria bacterium]
MATIATRSTFRFALAAALAALVLAAFGAQRASAQSAPSAAHAADEAAIAEFNRRYLAAINGGDIDALASLTTEGHMMISSGGAPLVGKKALVDAMARAFATTTFEESWSPEETVVSGDLAYQRGTFVVVTKPKSGGPAARVAGNFLRIYRKIDGAWFMVRDTFNSQQPRNGQ